MECLVQKWFGLDHYIMDCKLESALTELQLLLSPWSCPSICAETTVFLGLFCVFCSESHLGKPDLLVHENKTKYIKFLL